MATRGKQGKGSSRTGRIVAWVIVLAVIAALAFGGMTMNRKVHSELDDATLKLHAKLEAAYRHSTLVEVAILNQAADEGGTNDQDNLDKFLERAGTKPTSFQPEGGGYTARYQAKAWGRTRDILVRWRAKGVTIDDQ